MPIPFLIGGLVAAAAAAAAAYAFSDDDKSSSSSSSSGSDEAERHRKDAAEKERKERERSQKQQAAHADFQKRGRGFGNSLAQALPPDFVEARLRPTFMLDFDLKKNSMQFDMEKASQRDAHLFATIDGLESILTKRTSHQNIIENLAIFSELFKPAFQSGEVLEKKKQRVTCIDDEIDTLKKIKTKLVKLENEAASIQASEDTTL